ncbi:protein PNS1-like [Andrographis paniculata]|uniref:protein PNS1-like n=1 Tax=Andrographis paniculata TaxID=175694 RepID=UPI0021E72BA4|nr:protein PNS1-like [Andrographis paniculata]
MQTQQTNGTHLHIRREGNFVNKIFHYLFYLQFALIGILACYLTVSGFVSSAAKSHRFHPKEWNLPVISSTACAGIVAFLFQEFTSLDPSRVIKAAFWLGPFLTCGFGILLISIETPGSIAVAIFAFVCSFVQSLYACWISSRLKLANRIVSISIENRPLKVRAIVIFSIITCALYSVFLLSGIGGATAGRAKILPLFVVLILLSFIWTMQTAKNMVYVTISHVVYMQFASAEAIDIKTAMKNTIKHSMGSISIGSITVPVIGVITGLARAVNLISGDVDEFMFSCANCCSGVAARLILYGNKWGFVQVGVYNKGIVQASMDTWEMFKRFRMEKLIDSDLTSSFCFLCGVATGSTCALVGGTWALKIHKAYATEVSLYTFLTGYFMGRVAMAWIQASVAAYYVAYTENPQSQQFDSTILDYIQEQQRLEAEHSQ